MCLQWQHWTEALVWLDDVDISAFSQLCCCWFMAVLSEWHLLLSAYVFVCHCKKVGAWIRAANIKFFVILANIGNNREILLQVYGDNAMKKTAVKKWVKRFSEGSFTEEERSGQPATSRTEENVAKIHQTVLENCQMTVRSIAGQVNMDKYS